MKKSIRNPNLNADSVGKDYEDHGVISFYRIIEKKLVRFALFPSGKESEYENYEDFLKLLNKLTRKPLP